MRLLIFLTSLCAEGTPILVLQLCEYWQKQGLEIHLVTLQPTPNDLKLEFTALGIPLTTFPLGTGHGRYPRLLAQTYRYCRKFQPQAVLSMPLGWHAFIAWGAKLAGVKTVCAHVGNLPPVWTGSAFQKFKIQVQLGRSATDRLLCCSDYIRSATIRDFRISSSEAITIYNACNLEQFSSLQRSTHFADPPIVGMVARLEQHKDQPTLLRATALLKEQNLNLQVRLIGEGSKRSELEHLIAALNLASQVTLLGMRRDIPEQLSQLDLFIFAAKPDEGFGIALAEAMAAGVPIIATDVGACREVLQDGRCGLLVQANDPQALADNITEVLANPQAAQEKAKLARERALTNFGIAKMADSYLNELFPLKLH